MREAEGPRRWRQKQKDSNKIRATVLDQAPRGEESCYTHATVPQTGIIKRGRHLELNATGQGIYLLSFDLRHKLAIARLGLISMNFHIMMTCSTYLSESLPFGDFRSRHVREEPSRSDLLVACDFERRKGKRKEGRDPESSRMREGNHYRRP